ncbi:MAG: hypothetical protein ACYDEV_01450 [Acidiferrobacter sp.]
MSSYTPASQMPDSPLSDRFRQLAIPALHLWWRFLWRTLLLPVVIVLVVSLTVWISGTMAPGHRGLGFAGLIVGMGLLWFLLLPLWIVYSIWLIRRTLFLKPFRYHAALYTFVIDRLNDPLALPLPIESAMAIGWGILWRVWVGTMATMMALFFLGPLHFFLQVGVSYFAFLWLLTAPYGSTRITVKPLGAMPDTTQSSVRHP